MNTCPFVQEGRDREDQSRYTCSFPLHTPTTPKEESQIPQPKNYGRGNRIPTKKTPVSVSFPSKYFKMQGWRNIRILFKLAVTKLLDTLRIRSSYTLHRCTENRGQTPVCLAFGMMEFPLEWGVERAVFLENIIIRILSTLSGSHCKHK